MKPLSLKNGIQFLSPEQQALVLVSQQRPLNMYDLAERANLAPSTTYSNSNVLSALGIFLKKNNGTGNGDPATYQAVREKLCRLVELHQTRAPILDCTRIDLRILYVCSTPDFDTRDVLPLQIRKPFNLHAYQRDCEREYRPVLLEHAVVQTHKGPRDGCQLSEDGFRMLNTWRRATAIIHPNLH